MRSDTQRNTRPDQQSKNEHLVSTYRFIGKVFFVVLVSPDGYLWQKPWYVGQGGHPLFVLHAVQHTGKDKGKQICLEQSVRSCM